MKHTIDKKENNTAVITIQVEADEFEKGLDAAYKKIKNRINVPGFRKGKASRKMLEKLYGAEILFEDAINHCIPTAYDGFMDENNELDIVSRPKISLAEDKEVDKNGFTFLAEVALKPPVILGEYKGVEVEVDESKKYVTEEEIQKAIDAQIDKAARIVPLSEDEMAQKGDICVIDYEGFVDDVAFEGGKGESHPLELGSNSFIPGFEEQLVGVKVNEYKDVKVTFPKEYHAEELAGKDAIFKCYIHEIKRKEVPLLDDDLVQDISEFDTVDEYKNSIREKLNKNKQLQFKREKEDAVMLKISENATVELPDLMIETQTDNLLEEHFNNIKRYGLNPQKYMEMTGMTMDQMRQSMKDEAIKRTKLRLVLDEIVKIENLDVTDEEVEDKINDLSKQYKMEVDKIKDMLKEDNFESIKNDIKMSKTVDMLSEAAKITAPKE